MLEVFEGVVEGVEVVFGEVRGLNMVECLCVGLC